jgi:hypothetical protein
MSGESAAETSVQSPGTPQEASISAVVLQEIEDDLESALIRLDVLRRGLAEPAIARAIDWLRCAVLELNKVDCHVRDCK